MAKREYLLTMSIQYNIPFNTISSRQVIGKKPNSPNQHHKKFIAESKENYFWEIFFNQDF